MEYNKKLVLVDGTVFHGNGFGHDQEVVAEVIFNTGMTGYEDVITDGSYLEQAVVMTYPVIGNYGITQEVLDAPSNGLMALIVKEHCVNPSNWRSVATIDEALATKGIVGLTDVDTRALAIKIRHEGTMKGIIVDSSVTDADAIAKLNSVAPVTEHAPKMVLQDSYTVETNDEWETVALIDFGANQDALVNELTKRDCEVVVLPYTTSIEDIEAVNPCGVILGNGPGNPADLTAVLPVIQGLQEKYPLFAVNLGHQLFALANGATTSKMKFGHHGKNVPVKDITTGRTLITVQNHLYQVDKESLNETNLELTHYALNDGTVQGVKHKKYPAFSVQFLAEAHTGPADSQYLFDQFVASLGGK